MDTSASADVEKLQDVIRQLEVQNEKLRTRGSRQNTPNAKNKVNGHMIPSADEDILLLPILSDEDLRNNIRYMYFNSHIIDNVELFSNDNYISCLSKEDYEPVGSLFGLDGFIGKWESECDTESAEVAKRYIRRISER